MDISEYRTRFASFNSSLELSRYQNHVGLRPEFSVAEIYDGYSDLFAPTTIADLKARLEQTPTDQETERAGLSRLLNAARTRFVSTKTRDSGSELSRCELRTRLRLTEEVSFREAPARLAREADKGRRDELFDHWLNSIAICDEPRMAHLAALNESANALEFESYHDYSLKTTGADLAIEKSVGLLLEQTESAFKNALAGLLLREFPHLERAQLSAADLLYFEPLSWLDSRLPALDLLRIQNEILAALGIRMDQTRRIQVDDESRPGRDPKAKCFAVAPPDDVRLALLPASGASAFLDGCESFFIAQSHVWCSSQLARRHPEFVFADSATRQAYGYLFRYLPSDARWNAEFLPGLNEAQASDVARDVGLQLAIKARRRSADALCQANGRDDDEERKGSASTYEDLRERAAALRLVGELCLIDVSFTERPLEDLRALAFSFVLREHLRVRFGHRWWSSRRAGDELVDLWNTAGQYSVEELAAQIGFRESSFDLLARSVNNTLRGA